MRILGYICIILAMICAVIIMCKASLLIGLAIATVMFLITGCAIFINEDK